MFGDMAIKMDNRLGFGGYSVDSENDMSLQFLWNFKGAATNGIMQYFDDIGFDSLRAY